jgi:hypothetical protein
MNIIGIQGFSLSKIEAEVSKGARFVVYSYAISFVVVTIRRSSDVYFVRPSESETKALKYTLATLVFGWWGIPWGPIYSIQAIIGNASGGTDISREVLQSLALDHDLSSGGRFGSSRALDESANQSGLSAGELKELALRQQKLLTAIGLAALECIPILGQLAMVGVVPFQVWCVYKLTLVTKVRHKWLLIIGMLLPIVSLIVLLELNRRAIARIRSAGIEVGFSGIDPSKIAA